MFYYNRLHVYFYEVRISELSDWTVLSEFRKIDFPIPKNVENDAPLKF